MPATRFELFYDSFVRREVVAQLDDEKRNKINALLSNAAYLQGGDDALRARNDEIEQITEAFNDMVDSILDPQPEVDLSKNPFFAAGLRGLEKVKWEYMPQARAAQEAREAAAASAEIPV